MRLIYPLFLIIPLSFLSLNSLIAQADQTPTYEEVVHQFFKNYRPATDEVLMRFSRRPEGYFVERYTAQMQPDTSELFYSFTDRQYRQLSPRVGRQAKSKDYSTPTVQATSDQGANYLLRFQYWNREMTLVPYYGYPGWYKDVMEKYEPQFEDLSPWELQALARAYQSQGVAYLNNDVQMSVPEDRFDLQFGRGHLSEAEIQTYLDLVDKELITYERLIELDPDFMTPIGPVKTKYPHEIMDAFITLLRYQDEETARQVLRDDLYDDYLLHMGRNLLQSCPQDGLLFVWGDSDTYPLYYLQAVEGFRTDVILVNLSLVVTPRYQAMLYEGPFGAKPLNTKLPDHFFERIVVSYAMVHDYQTTTAPIQQLYQELTDPNNYTFRPERPDQIQVNLSSVNYRLDIPDALISSIDSAVFQHAHYFLPPDLIVIMDILEANGWERTLCFSPTVQFDKHQAIQPYLQWEGMVLCLRPEEFERYGKLIFSNTLSFPINQEQSWAFWENDFRTDTSAAITDFDKTPFHQQSLLAGIRLLQSLNTTGEHQRARQLGQRLQQFFPDAQEAWGSTWLYLAKELAKAGDIEGAEQVGLRILNNLAQKRASEYELNLAVQIRIQVCEMANEWPMPQLEARCY